MQNLTLNDESDLKKRESSWAIHFYLVLGESRDLRRIPEMKVRSLSPNRYLRELKLMSENLFMLQKIQEKLEN